MKKRLIIGISGGSGMPIAIELLRQLKTIKDIETHLIITHGAELTLAQESDLSLQELQMLADVIYDNKDIGAGPASGTFRTEGMIVVPCSMKTAAGICCGYSDNLLLRAADVTLKERRRLVLVPRECPLSTIHLRNLHELSSMGAEILPPVLSYYNHPQTIPDLTRHIVGKILDRFELEGSGFSRWCEEQKTAAWKISSSKKFSSFPQNSTNLNDLIFQEPSGIQEFLSPEPPASETPASEIPASEIPASETPASEIPEVLQKSFGSGIYRIMITALRCGKDLSLTVTGGTLPHIGASALAVYEPERDSATVSTMTVYTHRDDILASKCAKIAAKRIHGTVTAAVGIHIDHAKPEELQLLSQNCLSCLELVLKEF